MYCVWLGRALSVLKTWMAFFSEYLLYFNCSTLRLIKQKPSGKFWEIVCLKPCCFLSQHDFPVHRYGSWCAWFNFIKTRLAEIFFVVCPVNRWIRNFMWKAQGRKKAVFRQSFLSGPSYIRKWCDFFAQLTFSYSQCCTFVLSGYCSCSACSSQSSLWTQVVTEAA